MYFKIWAIMDFQVGDHSVCFDPFQFSQLQLCQLESLLLARFHSQEAGTAFPSFY